MKLREVLAGASVAEWTAEPGVEVTGLAYSSGDVGAGTPVLLRARRPGRRPRLRPGRRRGRRLGAGGRAPPRPRRAAGRGRRRAGGDGAGGRRLLRRPHGRASGRRDHRHERQDDDGLPAPPRARAGRARRPASSGPIKRVVGGVESEVERTTPEAIDLQRTFREMLDAGDRACAMEVSSHALALRRADGVRFAVATFTNLTQDHLDFHSGHGGLLRGQGAAVRWARRSRRRPRS